MPEEQKNAPAEETHWAIDLDWYPQNGRSMTALLKTYLCAGCAKRTGDKGDKKEPTLKVLLANIQRCCAKEPEFFSDKLPIMESTFRIFLHNGNKPMTLKELSSELGRVRSGDIYRTSPETLMHILKNDRFYGLQQVPD
jgi:hypothetical protein